MSKHKTDDDSGAGAVAAKQLSIPAAMDLAMRRHGAGNLAEAEAIYRRVLSAEPDNPFALHLLGVAAHQGGDHEGARGLIEKAIAAKPDFLEAFSNLGLVLQALGRLEDAASAYAQALAINPDYADAHYNLGLTLQSLGRLDDAAASYRASLALMADSSDALCKLGAVLQQQGHLDDAADAYGKALVLNPDTIEVLGNLGIILQHQGRLEAAVASYDKALALDPHYIEALSNRGAALQELGRLEDAVESCRKAIALKPEYAEAHSNLGVALQEMGQYDGAIEAFNQAVAANPDYAEAHSNLGLLQLLMGDFPKGWENYRWRRQTRNFPALPRSYGKPIWDGSDISGKRLLVWSEQGVGDEVFNAGMIPDLIERGINVVLESEARLVPLFSRSFPDVTCIAKDDPQTADLTEKDIDYCIPSGDLGRIIRPHVDSFPDRPSYLAADPDQRTSLRARYREQHAGPLIGLAWNSNSPSAGALSSLPLSGLRPLLETPGVTFFDLQYGDTVEERAAVAKETGIEIVGDESVDQLTNIDRFAAQVAAMDLVITIGSSTSAISGALGVPTWVMLRSSPLWFWGLNGDSCLWSSSMRLFRQHQPGDWTGVIKQVCRELADFSFPAD